MSFMEIPMATQDVIHSLRTDLLDRFAGKELTGAELGPYVKGFVDYRATYPTLSSGWLSQYVLDHLSDVLVEVGRKGLDRVFRVSEDSNEAESSLPKTYWHVFASPSPPYKLIANTANSSWQLLPRSKEPPAGLIEVTSMSRQELTSVAAAFLELHISDSNVRSELLQLYQGEYGIWRERLATIAPEAATHWSGYRQERLVEYCRCRFEGSGAPPEVIDALMDLLVKSRAEPIMQARPPAHPVRGNSQVPSLGSGRNVIPPNDLRGVASAALEKMTLGELEGVVVPLRVVFELIQERRGDRI
jgi:hypothetical protein